MNQLDKWSISDQAPDILYCNHDRFNFSLPGRLSIILKDNPELICFLTTEEILELDSSKFENKIIIYSLTDSDKYQKIRSVFFHLIENNIIHTGTATQVIEASGRRPVVYISFWLDNRTKYIPLGLSLEFHSIT